MKLTLFISFILTSSRKKILLSDIADLCNLILIYTVRKRSMNRTWLNYGVKFSDGSRPRLWSIKLKGNIFNHGNWHTLLTVNDRSRLALCRVHVRTKHICFMKTLDFNGRYSYFLLPKCGEWKYCLSIVHTQYPARGVNSSCCVYSREVERRPRDQKVPNSILATPSALVFTNHSQEHSLSFSRRFCNTTPEWLNRMV